MNVTFYNFSKRRNSTKLPSGGTSYTCLLKDDTTTARPRIAIKWDGTSGAPAAYNYCYIASFGRYYWVDSWEYTDRQWVASCTVDVLATYKTQIGSSSKYVLRAASDYDPEIIDTLYSPKAKPSYGSAQPPGTGFQWADDLDGGMIIVGIMGMRDTVAYSAGGVSYYACTPANYIKLLSQLFTESLDNVDNENYGSSFGDGFKAFSRNLLKSITDPTQYIKSVTWFPFSFSTGSAINPIIAGVITTAILYPLVDPIKRETVDFSISFNVNSSTDYWKNIPPFVRTTAYFPPYGTFDIDRRKFRPGINSIRCFITTDAVSGLSHLLISSATSGQTNNPTFGETICQVGVPLDFTGVKTGNISISSATNTAASFLGGNMLGAAAGVADLAASAMPTTESRSSYGGISGDIAPKYIETVWYEPQDEDNDEKGRPLCQAVAINTLSGYVLCADGEVDCNATESEHRELEAFLTGGFFYE